jgi:hypothetical protein
MNDQVEVSYEAIHERKVPRDVLKPSEVSHSESLVRAGQARSSASVPTRALAVPIGTTCVKTLVSSALTNGARQPTTRYSKIRIVQRLGDGPRHGVSLSVYAVVRSGAGIHSVIYRPMLLIISLCVARSRFVWLSGGMPVTRLASILNHTQHTLVSVLLRSPTTSFAFPK